MDTALTSVLWIACEPKLLIGISENGSLQLFSLLNGQQIPTNAESSNQVFTVMAINNKRYSLFIKSYSFYLFILVLNYVIASTFKKIVYLLNNFINQH